MWGSFGLAISMMLIAVLLSFTTARGYSEQLEYATSSASVTFFFTYVSGRPDTSMFYGRETHKPHKRCCFLVRRRTVFHGKIIGCNTLRTRSVNMFKGVCPRDSAPPCKSQRHSDRHFFELALGNLVPSSMPHDHR